MDQIYVGHDHKPCLRRLFINFFIHQSNFTKNGEIKPQPKQRKENQAMKCQMGVSERLTCLIET